MVELLEINRPCFAGVEVVEHEPHSQWAGARLAEGHEAAEVAERDATVEVILNERIPKVVGMREGCAAESGVGGL